MSVNDLFASRDCVAAGCPNEADGTDLLCGYCRGAVARPKFALPIVHSRREAEVPPKCKTEGCTNHYEAARGKYAYLCSKCIYAYLCSKKKAARPLEAVPDPEPVEAGPLLDAALDVAPAFELANEAAATVKDRMASYGPPEENHYCTAELWSAYLQRRADACKRRGVVFVLDGQDVCWMNVLQKISREANVRAGDNRLDVMGFAINAEMVNRS